MRALFVVRTYRRHLRYSHDLKYILSVNGVAWSTFNNPRQWTNNKIDFGITSDLIDAVRYLIVRAQ